MRMGSGLLLLQGRKAALRGQARVVASPGPGMGAEVIGQHESTETDRQVHRASLGWAAGACRQDHVRRSSQRQTEAKSPGVLPLCPACRDGGRLLVGESLLLTPLPPP